MHAVHGERKVVWNTRPQEGLGTRRSQVYILKSEGYEATRGKDFQSIL